MAEGNSGIGSNHDEVIVDTVDVPKGLMPEEEFREFRERVAEVNSLFQR